MGQKAGELLGELDAVAMDHRQGGAGRAFGPDPGNGRHDESGNGLVTLTCSFLEEAGERLLGGLVDRLVLGQQREEGALDEPDGVGAEMGFKLSGGDVEPGRDRPTRRQDLVIGGNVDQVVLDAGAEGVQRVFAVGPKRCGGQNNAGAAGVGDAGENPGEFLGRCLVALVDEDHPSPFAEAVEGAQEFLVIELVDEGHVRGGDHIRVERVPDHRLLADDLVLGDVERGLRTLYGRNTLELGVILAQEATRQGGARGSACQSRSRPRRLRPPGDSYRCRWAQGPRRSGPAEWPHGPMRRSWPDRARPACRQSVG